MLLTTISRRAACSLQPQLRAFSTVVDDGFTRMTAPSSGPPPPPQPSSALQDAMSSKAPRQNWTKDEIREIYNTPLMELAFSSVCPLATKLVQ